MANFNIRRGCASRSDAFDKVSNMQIGAISPLGKVSRQRAVHIHPTVSELIPTVLGEMKPLD